MSLALEVENLGKVRRGFSLERVTLKVPQGMSVGLIGANGAGKSTAVQCMIGYLKPTCGTIRVLGKTISEKDLTWKKDLGVAIHGQGFFENCTGQVNLEYFASHYPSWDKAFSNELCKKLDFAPWKKVSTLSAGERALLAFIAALSHRPKLMIMDELTANLDPATRSEVLAILSSHVRDGESSLLITSHNMTEISVLCDYVAFLKKGHFIEQSVKDDLLDAWKRISFRSARADLEIPGAYSDEREGQVRIVTTCDGRKAIDSLKAANAEILAMQRLSMEDIAVHILKLPIAKDDV